MVFSNKTIWHLTFPLNSQICKMTLIRAIIVQDLNPLNVSSTIRNPIIADVFARMDLMERRGSGLRKIIEAYKI